MVIKDQIFVIFEPNQTLKIWPYCPSNGASLAIFALNFLSDVFTTTIFALKGNVHVKYEKNLLIMSIYLLFFATLDLIWLRFCPKTTPTLIFFAVFQWNMLGDAINIQNSKDTINPLQLLVEKCQFFHQNYQ